jgi:hypothetical protein
VQWLKRLCINRPYDIKDETASIDSSNKMKIILFRTNNYDNLDSSKLSTFWSNGS